MAFAGEQPGRGIEPDPAGAGQENLGPGMQVREIAVGAGRAVEGFDIGFELDQVAGHEPRGEPEMTENFDQQPAGVAARPAAQRQRLLAGLHAGLHPHQVFDVLLQAPVQADEKIGRRHGIARHFGEPGRQQRSRRFRLQIGRQFLAKLGRIVEGKFLGGFVEEEIERILDRHVGDEIDLDLEALDRLGIDDARLVVAVGVLLPVDEVAFGLDPQRVA